MAKEILVALMIDTLRDIPDADILLSLEPEELAPIVLRSAVAAKQLHRQAVTGQVFDQHNPALEARFPRSKRDPIHLAIGEAWHWLITSGCIIPRRWNEWKQRLDGRDAARA